MTTNSLPRARTIPSSDALGRLVSLALEFKDLDAFLDDLTGIVASQLGDEPHPCSISCGVTLRTAERTLTVAASDERALAVDEEEYGQGRGPCLEAMETGAAVLSPDLAADDRWGDYARRAADLGVSSALALPLRGDDGVIGALNLYARSRAAFDDPAVTERAAELAAQAGAVVALVLRRAHLERVNDQQRQALASRPVIDQALGVLMGQERCTATAAFAMMRSASQRSGRKLRDVAVDVVTRASGQPPQEGSFTPPATPAAKPGPRP